jgi:hypothetical protein
LLLQKSFAKQPVSFDMPGKFFQDVAAVSNGFGEPIFF